MYGGHCHAKGRPRVGWAHRLPDSFGILALFLLDFGLDAAGWILPGRTIDFYRELLRAMQWNEREGAKGRREGVREGVPKKNKERERERDRERERERQRDRERERESASRLAGEHSAQCNING